MRAIPFAVSAFAPAWPGARKRTMDSASSCHAEKYPMKWLLDTARSCAALSGGLVRLKDRTDLIPDCGPRHPAMPLTRRNQ